MNYSTSHDTIKIKAFTLLELLVVMVLTIIVTAIAFNAYLIMQQQYISFKSRQNKVLDFQFFNTVLAKDFQSEGLIKRDGQQVIFYQPVHNIIYDFDENKILRSQQTITKNKDTISFDHKGFKTYFQSDIVNKGLIDSMVLSIDFFRTSQQLIFKKKYSSEELIKGKEDEY